MVQIADKFKSKRKELKLSQKALAEGICEQSQISKIERGNYMPSAELLYQLGKRLQVSMDYFFNDDIKVKSNLLEFKRLTEKLLNDRNYNDLAYLLQLEKSKKHFLSIEDETYLAWVETIIDFYSNDKKNEAIDTLETLSKQINHQTDVYLKILNTLANFYDEFERYEDYEELYHRLMNLYQEKDMTNQEYLFGYLKVRYNYAHHLQLKAQYREAAELALETIAICKEKETVHQLAHLLVIVGNAGRHFMDTEKVIHYYQEARELYKIYHNELMLIKTENYLQELEK